MTNHKTMTFTTYGSRWGEGKVHRYLWSYENKVWYVGCYGPYRDPHGKVTPADTPITCKHCLRS